MTILILSIFTVILSLTAVVMIFVLQKQYKQIALNSNHQAEILSRMIMLIKSKSDIGTTIEHAEIVYQDLVQHLMPIAAELKIKLRNSDEHILWKTIGGMLDEYANNPYVLEQLRRSIKLDANIARNVDDYMARAEKLLAHLAASDPDGILSTTFADGLLGQSLTFFTQAKKLATE